MIVCGNCGRGFFATASRWRCPGCGYRESCCEGEPQGATLTSALPTSALPPEPD